MDFTNIYIVGAILSVSVVAGVIFYRNRKNNLEKFFEQLSMETRQVPKQKKSSFLLLMFRESLLAAKNKSGKTSFNSKLQNPKYLDIQLAQMSYILKDPSKSKDKVIKKSLTLLNHYYVWEKAKISKDKKEVKNKAS